jgi:arylsulfatase A-like enzyme
MVTAGFIEGATGGDDYGLGQGFSTLEMGPQPGPAAAEWLGQHATDKMLLVLRGWSVGLDFGPDTTLEGVTAPDGFFERFQQVLASDFSDEPLSMEPQDLEYVKALYAARIKAADAALGELMIDLADLDLLDRATLVLTGTTGLDLERHGPSGSISLHTTVTRVPLLVRLPGGQMAQVVDENVELIDLMPTILELVGAEVPSGVQGASLVSLIEGAGRPPYIAFGESTHLGSQRAVALGGLRMVMSKDDGATAVFDLAADPLELNDLSEQQGDRAAVLQRHLEAWEKMVAAVSLDPELRSEEELDDETLEQLKSLGYIQ